MALLDAAEMTGRTRDIDALQGYRREYIRHWWVLSNNPNEDPVAVSNYGEIPTLGDSYPTDSRAYCVHKSARQGTPEKERLKWTVTCKYATLTKEQKRRIDFPNPLDRPYEISSNFQTFTVICEKDIHGDVITNTVGQQFDPPVEKDDSRKVLTITKNYATHSGALGLAYQNAINSDTFLGAAPKTLRLRNISEHNEFEEYEVNGTPIEVEFWRRTYEFEYKADEWTAKPLNQGRYQLESGELAVIEDADGNPVQDPVPLTTAGVAIAKASLPGAAVFLDFDVYNELPFSALGI
jgi:hypothetical protein